MEYERQRAYDIELGEERGFVRGKEEGFTLGQESGLEQKSVEAALYLIRHYNEKPEVAAKNIGAPLEKVLEALKNA